MTSNRNLKMAGLLALGLAAASFFARPASAQSEAGTFTLPIETRWDRAVLPPGNYSFTMNSTSLPAIITVRGEKTVAVVMAYGYNTRTWSDHSSLTLVRHGERGTVRSLQIVDLGLTFYYTPPKGKLPVVAKAPELIQQVPVVAGK